MFSFFASIQTSSVCLLQGRSENKQWVITNMEINYSREFLQLYRMLTKTTEKQMVTFKMNKCIWIYNTFL